VNRKSTVRAAMPNKQTIQEFDPASRFASAGLYNLVPGTVYDFSVKRAQECPKSKTRWHSCTAANSSRLTVLYARVPP